MAPNIRKVFAIQFDTKGDSDFILNVVAIDIEEAMKKAKETIKSKDISEIISVEFICDIDVE